MYLLQMKLFSLQLLAMKSVEISQSEGNTMKPKWMKIRWLQEVGGFSLNLQTVYQYFFKLSSNIWY